MKEVIIVAGANDSGKTTFEDFVKDKAYYFVNADEIGATLESRKNILRKD